MLQMEDKGKWGKGKKRRLFLKIVHNSCQVMVNGQNEMDILKEKFLTSLALAF